MEKKNALTTNYPIYEDPRYKKFEGIPLDKFQVDREKAVREYNQLQKDLKNLKEEYDKTTTRTKEREMELRNHINNLLIKFRSKDPDENLKNINELNEQIMINIKTLEEQSRQDIREKKKDMETRIKLRLADSEANYNKELQKKIDEQKEILRVLHEFTQDMQNIKNNYNSINAKASNYLQENAKYRAKIREYEEKNENLKSEIMELKHLNNKLNIKIMNKKNEDNKNLNEELIDPIIEQDDDMKKINKYKKEMKDKLEKEQKEKLIKKMESKVKREELSKTIKLSNINTDSKGKNENNMNDKYIEKIIELLSDENYVNKYFRECSIISSLLNIYEKSNKKIQALNDEYKKLSEHHPIYDRLIQIIHEIKTNEINSKLHSVNKISKRIINELLGNYIITMQKDQRKELIEKIITDEYISKVIYEDKLPNIMNRDRQLKI